MTFTRILLARHLIFAMSVFMAHPAFASGEIYRWVDEYGNIHFSDEQVRTGKSKKFHGKQLSQVKTVSTDRKWLSQRSNISTRKKTKKKSRNSKRQSNKASKCQIITNKTNKLEKLLRTKLKASKFDQHNDSLSRLKWEKIKYC